MPDHEPALPLQCYRRSPRKKTSHRTIVSVLAVLAMAAVLALIIPYTDQLRFRPMAERAVCANNMRLIGQAILMYQNDYGGLYPNTLDELVEEQIPLAAFTCPQSGDIAPTGATTQAIAADLNRPGRLSYIYLGEGLTDKTVTDDMVVLYEPLTNHGGSGMNVLFGDGHAEWFNSSVGQKLITAAATGQRVKITGGIVLTFPMVTTQPSAK